MEDCPCDDWPCDDLVLKTMIKGERHTGVIGRLRTLNSSYGYIDAFFAMRNAQKIIQLSPFDVMRNKRACLSCDKRSVPSEIGSLVRLLVKPTSQAWLRGFCVAMHKWGKAMAGEKRDAYNVINAFREQAVEKGWHEQADVYQGQLDWLKGEGI